MRTRIITPYTQPWSRPRGSPPFLRATDAVVYPLLTIRSAKLPCTAAVRWDHLFKGGVCSRVGCRRDVDDSAATCTSLESSWRCVQHALFACEAGPAACPRPADLWDDIFRTLPANSAARPRLWRAWGCDPEDAEAVWRECVPWMPDPAAMVTCERLDVQGTVCRLVAAYLLGVGAALSDSEVPSGHLNALMLPPWSRVA
jgi:hypothetical protein